MFAASKFYGILSFLEKLKKSMPLPGPPLPPNDPINSKPYKLPNYMTYEGLPPSMKGPFELKNWPESADWGPRKNE